MVVVGEWNDLVDGPTGRVDSVRGCHLSGMSHCEWGRQERWVVCRDGTF